MKKRVLFIVQGFGRGHLTQAISMRQLLEKEGYEVCAVLVGGGDQASIPAFFKTSFATIPVAQFISPEFITRNNRSIEIGKTIWFNLKRLRKYKKSIDQIDLEVKKYRPDLLLNFYDPLVGMYMRSKRPSIPLVCIAHQYLGEHPGFRFPEGRVLDRMALMKYSRLTCSKATLVLALSFYPLRNFDQKRICVVPPLLREAVHKQKIEQKPFYLVYLAVRGYRDDIIKWHRKNPETVLHVFSDQPQDEACLEIRPNLFFHKLSETKFLEMMASCKGLITTAGFESVCEALYLDKPVYMIPVEGHYEQLCNALDGFRAGAGIYDRKYNIDRFIKWLPTHQSRSAEFREWSDQAGYLISTAINNATTTRTNPFHTLTEWVASGA
ncbi:MAG: glycosyltransferase family protein [Bacteroidia bacterium]